MEKIASITKTLPSIMHNSETQVVVFAILCFIGAWVVVTKMVQIIFALIWPLIVILAVMVIIPNNSVALFSFWLPEYIRMAYHWLKKQLEEYAEGKFKSTDN